jgi:DNA-binding transcriptional regulator YhcF (GntR family)
VRLGDKALSIRDLAIALEVNPNTIQRAYDILQQQEIIVNKRGIGYFVHTGAWKGYWLFAGSSLSGMNSRFLPETSTCSYGF